MQYRLNGGYLALAAMSALSLVACGSDVGPALFGNDGGGGSVDYCATHPCNTQTTSSSTSGQGGGGVGGGMGSGGTTTTTTSSGTTTSSSSGTCVPSVSDPTRPALGIYYIQDRSGSMVSGTPQSWKLSTEGLRNFLVQPPIVPTSLGLQYAGIGTLSTSCNMLDYAIPAVAYAALPGVATAVTASLASNAPESGSPAGPAIAGAIQGAQTWAAAHPEQVSVVYFVADGAPNECDTNVASSYASAQSGNDGDFHIRTFVFGFGTANTMESAGVTFVNGLANAGGTTSAAFPTDATTFSAALSQASRDAVACSLMTPASSFSLLLDASDGTPATTLSQVAQRSVCGSSTSWYYTDASKKRIDLCPSACSLTSTRPLKVTSVCP